MNHLKEEFPHKKIGPYELLQSIGKGGMGEVYLAYDSSCGRQVALKQILPQYAQNKTMQDRFLREAKIAAQLAHPSIIPIYAIHQNGEAIRSCVVPVRAVAGAEITTIEGIAAKGLHPVQKAWMEVKVPQCGYCQAGQIMQAIALLRGKPRPSDQDINELMSGNICRCGTYQRIRAAIKAAATALEVS